MEELTVRVATIDDAPVVSALGVSTFVAAFGHLYKPQDLQAFLRECRSPECFARQIADPDHAVLLAERGRKALGYALIGPCKLPVPNLEDRAGELQQIYMDAGEQGNGTGTRLLGRCFEELTARNYAPIYIGVFSENVGAQRFYARHGFEKVGEYLFGVGEHRDREFILRGTADRMPRPPSY